MKLGVLVVGNFLSNFGNSHLCEELAARLAASEWPIVTTSQKPGRLNRLLDMITTTWHRRNDYFVAHVDVFSGGAFIWAEAVCQTLRLARRPYVLTLRGGNLPDFARCWPRRVRHLLHSAAAVTAPSRYLVQNMHDYCSEIRLLPNPLDVTRYSFRVRKRLQPRLIWLRAFHHTYNPELAPRVLAGLTPDFPDIALTMIGPDKGDGSLQRMQQLSRDLGVADRIELPGRIPKAEVSGWMSRADIFLNTTKVDNTPITVLEAMASGLCVVSTNVGGIPYLLENEHDALLVSSDDASAMAKAVRRLFTEPELAERLSSNARLKAEGFDWSVLFPEWEELLIAAMKSAS